MDHLEEEHHYPGLTLAGEKDGEVIAVRFHSNSIYDAGGFLAEYKFDKSTGGFWSGVLLIYFMYLFFLTFL